MTIKTKSGSLFIKTSTGFRKIFPPDLPEVIKSASVSATTNTVTVTWASLGASVTGYQIKLNGSLIGSAGPSAVEYTFTNLAENTDYTITVAGVSGLGVGPAITKTIKTATTPVVTPNPEQPGNDSDGVATFIEYTDPDLTASRNARIPAAGTYDVGQPKKHIFNEWSESRRIITNAPLHPNSAEIVNDIVTNQITAGAPSFNVKSYGHPVYVVRADQPRVNIGFADHQNKGYAPGDYYNRANNGAFLDVPIPDDAIPAVGTDSAITIWCPETDQMWGLWVARKNYSGSLQRGVSPIEANKGNFAYQSSGITDWTGWSATHGGRMDNVSQVMGTFPFPVGVTASGVASESTAVTVEDVRSGSIEHMMSLQMYQPKQNSISYPANRTDGWTTRTYAPSEGMRLRLDPTLDVDSLTNLTPIAKMIAKAAQKYGFMVTDKAGVVAVPGEEGSAYKKKTGVDPWDELMAGKAYWQILQNFPWSKLQALPFDYGKPGNKDTKSSVPIRYREKFAGQDRTKVGENWGRLQTVNDGGFFSIVSNQLTLGNNWRAFGFAPVACGTLDQWGEIDVTALGASTSNHPELTLRAVLDGTADATYERYWFRYNPTAGAWEVASRVGGTNAVRASFTAPTPAVPYTMRAEVKGTLVKLFHNGTKVIEWTDPAPPQGGYSVGLALPYNSAADRNVRVGRLEYGDIVPDLPSNLAYIPNVTGKVDMGNPVYAAGSGWSRSSASTTANKVEVSTTTAMSKFLVGDRSVYLETDGVGGTAIANRSGSNASTSFDLTSGSKISRILLYIENSRDIDSLVFTASNDAFNNGPYIQKSLDYRFFHDGWNTITFNGNDYYRSSSPNLSSLKYISLSVKDKNRGVPVKVWLNGLWSEPVAAAKGAVCLTFDDGYASTHDLVLPMLNSYGLKGTCYVMPGNFNQGSTWLTETKAMNLKDAGWTLGAHAWNSSKHVAMTGTDLQTNFTQTKDWLSAHGVTRHHLAYWNGLSQTNSQVIQMVKDNFITGRNNLGAGVSLETLRMGTPWCYRGWLNSAVPVNDLGGEYPGTEEYNTPARFIKNHAISSKGLVVFTWHNVGSDLSASTFETFVKFVKSAQDAGDLDVLTIDQAAIRSGL